MSIACFVICGIFTFNLIFSFIDFLGREMSLAVYEKEALIEMVVSVVIPLVLGFVCRAFEKRRKEKRRKMIEQEIARAEEEKRQKRETFRSVLVMTDAYARIDNPTAVETKAVWKRYNHLLQTCQLQSGYPVFCIRAEVGQFLWKIGFSETGEEHQTIIRKLLLFYYQVAMAGGLEPQEQEQLLQYLLLTFEAKAYGEESVDRWDIFSLELSYNEWREMCLELLEKNCEKNSLFAMIHMAECCYFNMAPVYRKDDSKAFALYKRAAQLGNVHSVYMMGRCYEEGRGTRTDYQKAGDCYQYAYNLSDDKKYSDMVYNLYNEQRWDKHKYSPDIFTVDQRTLSKENLEKLKGTALKWEKTDLANEDLRTVAFSIGAVLEEVVNTFVNCYESDHRKEDLKVKITLLYKKGLFTREISDKAHTVRMVRNRGVHPDENQEPLTQKNVKEAISYLWEILKYYEQY